MTTEGQTEKTIAFVLYPGLTLLDLVGPLQVLSTLGSIAPEYRTVVVAERLEPTDTDVPGEDRKSTRLNSSHANISYAVFCLKKNNNSYISLSLTACCPFNPVPSASPNMNC